MYNYYKLSPSLFAQHQSFFTSLSTNRYLKRLSLFIVSNFSQLPAFFAWNLLKKLSPALPETYFAAYYFGSSAGAIDTKGKERWRACLLDTETRMPLTVGMMFTNKIISNKEYNKVYVFSSIMPRRILHPFRQLIKVSVIIINYLLLLSIICYYYQLSVIIINYLSLLSIICYYYQLSVIIVFKSTSINVLNSEFAFWHGRINNAI